MSEIEDDLRALKSLVEKLAKYKVGQTVYVLERILDEKPKVRAVRVGRIGFDGVSTFKYYDEHGAPIGYADKLAASLDELKARYTPMLESVVGAYGSIQPDDKKEGRRMEYYRRILEAWRALTEDDVIRREE